LIGLQTFLNSALPNLGVLCPGKACPQLPTIAQGVLEIAAQFNVPAEMVRRHDNDPYAAIAANPPLKTAQIDLSTLTPLAFNFDSVSGKTVPTQPTNATSLFYAVAGTFPQPVNTLHLIYQGLGPTADKVVQGQTVAKISLPLVVLSGGTETAVQTTLQFVATCNGGFADCVGTVLATGNFSGKGPATVSADEIGLTFGASFGPPAIFQVDVPLVVTRATDTPYFQSVNPNEYVPTVFSSDQTGFTPKSGSILGPKASIGIAPFAAPLCPNNSNCSANQPVPAVFGFCASLPNSSTSLTLQPAVAGFVVVANDAETLASAPVNPTENTLPMPGFVCPMF
jgi:hypothetical protein